MTNHAQRGAEAARSFAGNVRAEMARQNRTAAQLASVLGVTAHTAGRRLAGKVNFSAAEVVTIAAWLRVTPTALFAECPVLSGAAGEVRSGAA